MQLLELREARGLHKREFTGMCFAVQVCCGYIGVLCCYAQCQLSIPSDFQGFSIAGRVSIGAVFTITLFVIFF